MIRRKYPGHCPYHLTHNVLGMHFGQHESCTAAPFSSGACAHGSHSDPAYSAEARSCKGQVAAGKTLQLPLGLSRRAGSTKLHDGCLLCHRNNEFDVACMACGRAWTRSRRRGSRPVAADDAAWYAWCQAEMARQGGDGGASGSGGQASRGWEEHEDEWYGKSAEHWEQYGEEGGEDWEEEEEELGEEGDYEGGGGCEESESSGSSSSGEEEPPRSKRARAEPGPSSAAAPLTDSSDAAMLALRLEAAQATVRALEMELKLVKSERDAALKRAGE